MKKLLVFCICVFILSACSAGSENYYDVEGFTPVKALDEYVDSSVLLYGDDEIYFYQIGGEEENSVLTLYEYDLDSNKTRTLGEISRFFMTVDSSVLLEDGFVFTVCTQEESGMVNHLYCCKDGRLQELHSQSSSIPMSFVSKVSEEEVILFSPDSVIEGNKEYYSYTIKRINLENGKGTEVIQFQYNITDQKGDVVPAVDYDGGRIYAFKKATGEPDSGYTICSYDLEGGKAAEYDVDIEDFLYLELTSSYDSVFKIKCFGGRIFVLQTLNNRIIIYEERDDRLVRVEAPEKLSVFPEGYKLAQYQDGGLGEVYFANMFSDTLIKFDVSSGEFTELKIEKDSPETYISSLHINPRGDILACMDDQYRISTKNDFGPITGDDNFPATSDCIRKLQNILFSFSLLEFK